MWGGGGVPADDGPPLGLGWGVKEEREVDIDAIVLRYTQILERLVRAHPEQYFWQHRRWRRQPPDTPPHLREP
jgi:lauroyl/myristoyl acyltransferase